jgi:hypothetical protein
MDHLTPRERWRKSSYSSASSDNCVEAAAAARTVAVRDSKDPCGPRLAVPVGSWAAFTQRIRQGDASRLQRQQRGAPETRCAPFCYT